jgi:preprotein translocase subunit SecA
VDLAHVRDSVDDLVERCWANVEKVLRLKDAELGLYTFLFYVRQIYLREIDEQWIAHLKNIEHLRTGIGLVGYATRNPKNEYKIRGYNLFKDMWDGIERTVLDAVLKLQLTEEQRRLAEEGAEYETTLTRASLRREPGAAARGRVTAAARDLDRAQAAARRAIEQLTQAAAAAPAVEAAKAVAKARAADGIGVPKVGGNDPCPCGSGKRYKKCHGRGADERAKVSAG